MTKIIAPKLNWNGTSSQVLLRDWQKAHTSISTAYDALRYVTPHPRDFQTAPEGEYDAARIQHDARLKKIQEVFYEIEAIMMDIDNQRSESGNKL